MSQSNATPLRGRQAEARRNDERVLRAAREVLTEEGPGASMASIATRAGVGVASLYARYPSKEDLIRQLSIAAMRDLIDRAQAARQAPDAWQGFVEFMRYCTDAGAGSLMQLAATFRVTDEHLATVRRLHTALRELLRRTRAQGGLRADFTPTDLYLLLANLRFKHPVHPERTPQLRQRYLALILAGLRATDNAPLPGQAPSWNDLAQLWTRSRD